MSRRDAFSGLRDPKTILDVDGNIMQQSSTMLPKQIPAGQPLDLIPTADFRKKRSRKWENAHRSETVTYRGVPRQAVEWIVEISQSLSVPRDEVVRAFLEYGMALYRSGQLTLFAYPKAQRMTLFPENEKTSRLLPSITTETHSWLKDAFPVPAKKAGGAKKKKDKKNQGGSFQLGNAGYLSDSRHIKGRDTLDLRGAHPARRRGCPVFHRAGFKGLSGWQPTPAAVTQVDRQDLISGMRLMLTNVPGKSHLSFFDCLKRLRPC